MNKQVLIIEDELHNSRLLTGMIESLRPQWDVIEVLESVQDSVIWLQENPAPDLIMLDIQLADGVSFDIFKKVTLDLKTKIIFTTAYDNYAIQAFKVNSIDYLLKPIKESELEQAFLKLESFDDQESKDEDQFVYDDYYKSVLDSIVAGKKEYRTRFLVAGSNTFKKLNTKDIAYVYSENKVSLAVDFDNNQHILDYTLEQLEAQLNPEVFYRANRQAILNVDCILKIKNDMGGKLKVITEPKTEFDITVSRLKATDFKEWLGK